MIRFLRLLLFLPAAWVATSAAAQEFMLTFDDGPLPEATDKILRALADIRAEDGKPVRAGFFLVGSPPEGFGQRRKFFAPYELWGEKGSVAAHPGLVRKILAAGHVVGNHSVHHGWFRWPWLGGAEEVEAEIAAWDKIARPLLGDQGPRLFRPPYFVLTPAVREGAAQAGYRIVMGVSSGDAAPLATPYAIEEGVSSYLEKWSSPQPCVLVFHENRAATREGLAEIVAGLKARGHRLAHFDPARLADSASDQRLPLQAAVQAAEE